MTKIRNAIASSIATIMERAAGEESAFATLKKLLILAEANGSLCSKDFRILVSELADIDPSDPIEMEQAEALQEMFEADQLILESATDDENSELARFSILETEKAALCKKCEQMRKIVWASDAFDLPHRNRMLKRISAIETEINKEFGLFDVVLGGLSDFGEISGKFGNDVKPLVDRMRELAGIVRRRTPDYDKLPPPDEIKRLPAPKEDQA